MAGIGRANLSQIENGAAAARITTLYAIAKPSKSNSKSSSEASRSGPQGDLGSGVFLLKLRICTSLIRFIPWSCKLCLPGKLRDISHLTTIMNGGQPCPNVLGWRRWLPRNSSRSPRLSDELFVLLKPAISHLVVRATVARILVIVRGNQRNGARNVGCAQLFFDGFAPANLQKRRSTSEEFVSSLRRLRRLLTSLISSFRFRSPF